jgi:hypothetical protein
MVLTITQMSGEFMKSLLIVMITLASISAIAFTPYDVNQEHSRNYRAIYTNDDLSISIFVPRFSNPDGGGNLFLSPNSDLDGVCRLYGLNSYVEKSVWFSTNSMMNNLKVQIGSNGYFYQFEKTVKHIFFLSCTRFNQPTIPISQNYLKKLLNDDGSITFVEPRFKFNGADSSLSPKSDLNSICRLYGAHTYVNNSLTLTNINEELIITLNANSTFDSWSLGRNSPVIKTIICR